MNTLARFLIPVLAWVCTGAGRRRSARLTTNPASIASTSCFGPSFDLAQALLQRGHGEAVKHYLRDINRFWDRSEVDEWIARIDKGERPRLDGVMAMSRGFRRVALAVLAWPALVVLLVWAAYGRKIPNASGFVVTALVLAYASTFAIIVATSLGIILIGSDVDMTMAVMPYAFWGVPALALLGPILAAGLVARRFARPRPVTA